MSSPPRASACAAPTALPSPRPTTPAAVSSLPRPLPLPRRVLQHWVSRFDIWPFLERFTIDATKELLAELGGKPDLIIGNYRRGAARQSAQGVCEFSGWGGKRAMASWLARQPVRPPAAPRPRSDGNLVATLMAHRMNVTQCTIAHALEKTKCAGEGGCAVHATSSCLRSTMHAVTGTDGLRAALANPSVAGTRTPTSTGRRWTPSERGGARARVCSRAPVPAVPHPPPRPPAPPLPPHTPIAGTTSLASSPLISLP